MNSNKPIENVAIIGAGIAGITTAYALLERGFEVSIFDKNRYAAMGTSFANGGQLSASNAEVWTRWATIFKGIKWMFEPGAPLLVNPKPSWHKYSWMAEFMASIPHYEANTVKTVELAIAAREHLKRWADKEGFEFDCEDRGILHIYKDPKELAHARKVNKLLEQGGLERFEVDAAEAKKIEPALDTDLIGGFYTPSDFSGDIHVYASKLSEACERLGANFYYETEVDITQSDTQGHVLDCKQEDNDFKMQFDAIVVCAGVGSRAIASKLGDRVNIYPVKGYSITVNMDDEESQQAAPHVSLLDDKAKIVASRLGDDRFRIAGTAEYNGYNKDIRDDRIKPLVKWCETWFPKIRTEHAIPWAGLRPMMPNMMPRLGVGKKPGVFYNTGHGHLGWTLSAATAEITAENISSHAMKSDTILAEAAQ